MDQIKEQIVNKYSICSLICAIGVICVDTFLPYAPDPRDGAGKWN